MNIIPSFTEDELSTVIRNFGNDAVVSTVLAGPADFPRNVSKAISK